MKLVKPIYLIFSTHKKSFEIAQSFVWFEVCPTGQFACFSLCLH